MLIVITGPPAAGKSSWIRAHAKPHDVVIDFDHLCLALAGPGADTHAHHPVLEKIAHRARFAAINEGVRHLDEVDVYLIHTQPSAKARAKYKRLGARIVVVDPGKDVVLQRVRDMRQTSMVPAVERWYAQHTRLRAHTVTAQASRSW